MLSHVHHINLVVKDLERSILYFDKLFSQVANKQVLLEREVLTAKYKVGNTYFVLVQPTSSKGVVASILATKGEGIFLVSFGTDSIEDTLEKLDSPQCEKRNGIDGWCVYDIAAFEQFGAVLQLTEN